MHWAEKYHLGLRSMDEQHRDFVSLLKDLRIADKGEFSSLFRILCEHIAAHFEFEDALMQELNFPARVEHRGEHLRVLGELVQFNRQVEQGRTMMAQAYVNERLPEWFGLHVSTMDSALAAHVNKVTI